MYSPQSMIPTRCAFPPSASAHALSLISSAHIACTTLARDSAYLSRCASAAPDSWTLAHSLIPPPPGPRADFADILLAPAPDVSSPNPRPAFRTHHPVFYRWRSYRVSLTYPPGCLMPTPRPHLHPRVICSTHTPCLVSSLLPPSAYPHILFLRFRRAARPANDTHTQHPTRPPGMTIWTLRQRNP